MEEIKKEKPILNVKNLRISFKTNTGTVKAVRGIDFSLYKGRTLAIVGESGSGKSVTSKAILGILANNKIIEDGHIIFDGKDLLSLPENKFTKIRGVKISMIFQDPLSALNPIMRVGKQLTEAMRLEYKARNRYSKKYINKINKAIKTNAGSDAFASINYSVSNIRLVEDLKAALIKNDLATFMSALSTETVKYVEALKVALEQVKNYQANNLSVNADEIMEKNNFKKAIKEVNALKSYLNNCSNIFDKEPDDVISVYVSLAKKYLNSMAESVKLKANIEKIYAENNVTDFFDLPSKVRAKQREVIVEKEVHYNSLIKFTNKLIKHIEELLAHYETVAEDEVKGLINEYAQLNYEVRNNFGASDAYFERVNDLMHTLDTTTFAAFRHEIDEFRDADKINELIENNYRELFANLYKAECEKYVASLNSLKEVIRQYSEVNLVGDSSSFILATATKDIQPVMSAVKDAKFSLEIFPDEALNNCATSILNNIKAMTNIGAEQKRVEALLMKYNVDSFEALPESVKAYEVKPQTDISGYYNQVKSLFTSLVELIDKYVSSYSDETAYKDATDKLIRKYADLKVTFHKRLTANEAKFKAIQLMREVGIPNPERRYYQYPFEFSGGMRQRIVIAIALSGNPEVLICDEPTTALDVTIQAQIIELIQRLKVQKNLSIIFITHDLGVVANVADDIAVMYAGKIVEYGSVYDIFYDPRHPYTWALLSSMPDLDTQGKLDAIPGTPPNMLLPPRGDAFAARNSYAVALDYKQEPPFFKVSETHSVKTWLAHKDSIDVVAPKTVTSRIARSLAKNPDNTPSYELKKNSVLEMIKGGKK